MAASDAERKRRSREKQRTAALKNAEASVLEGVVRQPFFSSNQMEGNWSNIVQELDTIGMDVRGFYDDGGMRSYSGLPEQAHEDFELTGDRDPYLSARNSLGRAEMMVGGLVAAGQQLAALINEFKKEEITARISEIEQSDLSDPAAKKQALADIVRLQKMLDQLDKQVRWTFPQWKVTGE